MTAPAADPTPDPAENPPAQGDTGQDAPPAKPETDWRAEAKKWEARAKENKSAADKLVELENASKSELQLIQERADAAEKRAADLEAAEQKRIADGEAAQQVAAWKTKIAEDTGIPASALRGNTLDELRDHAKELQALLPPRRGGAFVPAEGRTTGQGGNDPSAQFADIIRKARGL